MKAQSDYPVTLLFFFLILFVSLIGLGYYFLYQPERIASDKCLFLKVMGCNMANLTPEGVQLQLVNMYGMDIKAVTIKIESKDKSNISCKDTVQIGDLANTMPTGVLQLCKPSQPYQEQQYIAANIYVSYQDPLLNFNEKTAQGELRLKLQQKPSLLSRIWDKIL